MRIDSSYGIYQELPDGTVIVHPDHVSEVYKQGPPFVFERVGHGRVHFVHEPLWHRILRFLHLRA